jgi:integrase
LLLTLCALREQYRLYYLNIRNVCADTAKDRLRYLDILFDYFGLPQTATELCTDLTPVALTEFLIDYSKRHGPGARHGMYTTVRGLLRFLYEEQYLSRDLSGLVPSVRQRTLSGLPRALPSSCICALEESIDSRCSAGLRDSAIICLLSTYGVRGVQIRRLRLEHIDWQNERIHFPPAKRGRPIEQHLTAKAGNRLADYISKGRPSSDLPEVFLTLPRAATKLGKTCLPVMIRRRLQRSEIPIPEGVSQGTHGFRHAFAVRMTGEVSFKEVVDMLGHRDPSSTLIYAKADVQTLQQAALPWPGGAI